MHLFPPSNASNSMIGKLPRLNFWMIIRLDKRVLGVGNKNTTWVVIKIGSSINCYNDRSIFINFFLHCLFISTSIIVFADVSIVTDFPGFRFIFIAGFDTSCICLCVGLTILFYIPELKSILSCQNWISSITSLIVVRTCNCVFNWHVRSILHIRFNSNSGFNGRNNSNCIARPTFSLSFDGSIIIDIFLVSPVETFRDTTICLTTNISIDLVLGIHVINCTGLIRLFIVIIIVLFMLLLK